MKLIASALAATGKAIHAAWTAPLVLFAAFLIAWGAEAAQFLMSQGLALAVLAWLQTLPEFAVEAELAWQAGRGTAADVHLVTANFTGSIRLIMGFGMPVVYFISTRFWSRARSLKPIVLDPFHSVEIISLFPPIIYFLHILHKGSLDVIDSIVLLSFYALYLGLLLKMPPEEEEDISELPLVSRWILRCGRMGRILGCVGVFVAGGAILYFTVHPFIESLKSLAVMMGMAPFFFIQWVAPFLSEMPEKVSAFAWAARSNKASMSLMNFLSSNLNQLTVLVAMVPIVFVVSAATAPEVDELLERADKAKIAPLVSKHGTIDRDRAHAMLLDQSSAERVLSELERSGARLLPDGAALLRSQLREELREAAVERGGEGLPRIRFNHAQLSEVLLTVAQAALCLVLLLNMKFEWWDAVGMFVLFIAQFLSPLWAKMLGLRASEVEPFNESFRVWVSLVYLAWIGLEAALCLARVRNWQFPMLARPSRPLFQRQTRGPDAR